MIIVAATAIAVLLSVAFWRRHFIAAAISLLGLAGGCLALVFFDAAIPQQVTKLLIVDRYAVFFMGLIYLATIAVAILAYGYLKKIEGNHEEFYIVLLLATLGAAVMVASDHFAAFFLGLELLTVSLYVMIAYLRASALSLEAGMKYLILAAASSAFLLFGMALIYAELGTMQFGEIASKIFYHENAGSILLLTGMGFMIVGIGFKLAVVPFHLWTPDVYEGAPAPVTAYIATVSKGAVVALLLRFFAAIDGHDHAGILRVFGLIAVASMFAGNFLALLQANVKRILAYSSIAHLGYILVAFVAGDNLAVEAVTYYLVAYFVTTLGAFGIVTLLSAGDNECVAITDYRGLFWRRPWLAAVFTAVLLSLAGIPLTAGFIGKYFVIAAGVSAARWALVIILAVNSAIGLYYYLRIVVAMMTRPTEEVAYGRVAAGGGIVLAALALALVWLGVYPAPLIQMIRTMLAGFL